MKKSTRILLVIILCLVLVAISLPGRFSFNHYEYDNAGRYTAGGCTIDQPVKTIDLSWISGKVKIARHSGDEIRLTETASRKLKEAEQVHWLLDGDTLYVKYVRAGKLYSSRMDKELTLLLPEDLHLDGIRISGVSAQIGADLPQADAVSIQSVSGDADVALQQAGTVRIDTVSGDVALRMTAAPRSIDADAVSADVTIRLPESAGFHAELDSVSGRVGGSLLEGAVDVKAYTRGSGECRITMNSVSGDLRLDAAR